jgi:hypothetical protein
MTRALEWLLRLALAALLLWAGVAKLGDPAGFAVAITNYHLLPSLAPYVAVTLPTIELVIGAALLVAPRAWRRAAALCATGLMAVFTVAVAQVVVRGINVSCGCFGGDSGPVTWLTVLRDVALCAAAVALIVLSAAPSERRATP